MADESEKKTGVVLNKHVQDSHPAGEASPKRKIVIKRKAPSAETAKQEQKKRIHVVSKKTPDSSVKAEDAKTEVPVSQEKTVAVEEKKPVAPVAQPAKPQVQTLEFPNVRPNVKAGNLSGGRSRYSNNGNGRRDGGFTGSQARESYQNRERQNNFNRSNPQGANFGNRNSSFRGNPNGGFNRNNGQPGGFNRGPGGFNRNGTGGGFNRGPGGFNRNNGQPGGFNRGPGGFNRGPGGFAGGAGRPGFGGPRPGGFADPSAIAGNKAPAKKQFKGKKQVYNRKDKEDFFDEEELYQNKKHDSTPASVVPEKIEIMETISVSDLARKMNLKASEIIGKLMSMGMMVTINQSIDSDTATILASEYNCQVHLVSLYDETVIESDKGSSEGERTRPPIVTVMGHVDHGKTKTLDAIRNADVAAGEAGGITQKIGAYQVSTPKGVITFLDTPGHEAFTMMRARGAQITDIVVLVVAADDGVMPQTMEAINHAKDAKVPIIVAVNKIDKPDANPEKVMTQLSELGLTPEAWGGDTQYVNISALKHQGIDDLLDAILIQAEVLELKAQYDCRAEGKVIESRTDQGRGVVASVVVQRGTLHIGDPLVAGIYSGRVRAIFNDRGQKIQEATPSMPVEVLGLEAMPNAGDPIQVTETEKDARAFAAKRQELKRFEDAKAVKKVTLDNLYSTIEASEVKEFKVIIKADLQGSAEALKTSLEKLSTKELRLVVIHSSAGAINESDVTLAAADENAIIIGFNVRPTPKAKALAEQEKVEIRKYNIIYKCVEEIQQAMEGMLQPDTKDETTGTAEVRNTFKVPKIGVIAGCYVTDGVIKKTCSVNVIRDGVVIYTGKIASLKRFKDDAKEVKDGFECGIGIENWQDLQIGDQLEAFETIEVKRKLGKTLADEKAEAEKKNAASEDSAE
ncbi:translation initiation factor IF-2 [uncultured Treponema sp.]|uniref:translation initiation factor IF-2 n=1 Tax=uncultured Treponema sp. TaxID=162155 RepID=UPI0025EDD751|nr:translation initiation factor IF-2 [uncultured Treponema sp.]